MTIYGSKPGPTTTIMVGVHGNELSGPLALTKRLASNPTIDTGTVFCIFANPRALEANVRQTDQNMNRCFGDCQALPGYEADRANEIISYLRQSDFLLDIHNTIDQSAPAFLISEYKERNQYFPVSTILCGLDTLHPGGSDGYMNSLGKVGLCLECGSIVDDLEKTTATAFDAIDTMLCATGNISYQAKIYLGKQNIINCTNIYKNIHGPFRLVRPLEEFEFVGQGTVIGYDGKIPVYATQDCRIVFARDCEQIGEECFVWGN